MRPILPHEAKIAPLRDASGVPQVGDGPAKDTARFTEKRVEYTLAGAWDITLEGSVDGVAWTTIQANIIAGSAIIEVPEFWRKMRVVTNVAGTMLQYSVHLGGFDTSAWE